MNKAIDKLNFILVGMSGAIMGMKAALIHGGEVKAEVLDMLHGKGHNTIPGSNVKKTECRKRRPGP